MAMNTLFANKSGFISMAGLVLIAALGWSIGCSSSDEAPGGGRLAYPVETGPNVTAPSRSTPLPSSTTLNPQPTDPYLSPMDKAIAQDRPSRPWSKKVPTASCAKDEECGDGFCDRGHCAAVWTGDISFGQRCRSNADCIVFLCLEGRCRSCVSTAECIDEPDNQNPECRPNPPIPEARGCRGVAGAGEGDIAPGFPPRRL